MVKYKACGREFNPSQSTGEYNDRYIRKHSLKGTNGPPTYVPTVPVMECTVKTDS